MPPRLAFPSQWSAKSSPRPSSPPLRPPWTAWTRWTKWTTVDKTFLKTRNQNKTLQQWNTTIISRNMQALPPVTLAPVVAGSAASPSTSTTTAILSTRPWADATTNPAATTITPRASTSRIIRRPDPTPKTGARLRSGWISPSTSVHPVHPSTRPPSGQSGHNLGRHCCQEHPPHPRL